MIRKSPKRHPTGNTPNRGPRAFQETQTTFDQTLRPHKMGGVEDVATHYKRTLILRPKFPKGHNHIGAMQAGHGRVIDLRIRQGDPNVHNALGLALVAGGRFC